MSEGSKRLREGTTDERRLPRARPGASLYVEDPSLAATPYREDPTAVPPLDLTIERRAGPLTRPEAEALPEEVAPNTEQWGASADLAHERFGPPPATRAPEELDAELSREDWGPAVDEPRERYGPPHLTLLPPEREY